MSLLSSIPSFPPILFALVVVSVLSAKILHIFQHIQSLPFVYFVLYSPTLFIPDAFVIIVLRLLLQSPESRLQCVLYALGIVLALLSWFAASVQFGFFFETGSEIQWSASESFLRDPAAMKILFSGIYSVMAAAAAIFFVSFVIGPRLHSMTGRWVHAVQNRLWESVKQPRTLLPYSKTSNVRQWSFHWILPTIAISISLLFLLITRPAVPYNHLSGAVPLNMLNAFHRPPKGCRPPPRPFPLWDFGGKHHGGKHHGGKHHHMDWSFGKGPSPPPPLGPPPDEELLERPSWLPMDPPPGFHRWEAGSSIHEEEYGVQAIDCPAESFHHYNSSRDPLKVSNLDLDILGPLQDAFKDVDIQHVVLLTLESGRKELFPTQPGTPLYDAILESHEERDREDAMDKLAQMTLVSQMLTGEYATDSMGEMANLSESKWQDSAAPGMGGINVKGALTGSSLTLKSVLMGHCGASPLPVEFLEEVNLDIYQPCLPQIFDLFNREKDSTAEAQEKPFVENPWNIAFVQSCTDSYDRQDQLMEKMGFDRRITKDTLDNRNSTHYPPKTDEVNYFGYAEEETYPYLRDLVFDSVKNNSRLFLSHLTSITHHPWGVPDYYEEVEYSGDRGSVDHSVLDKYLNTIRYVDEWLGKILGILDEAGISNSTLIAITGDHGQAFGEDWKVTGTFENGHISNFRVPLVFRHPQLPRVDISANATSLSILPTILDLLVQSKSLNKRDTEVASAILPEYQGQSMIRPFKNAREDGVAVWNFGLINSGGSMMAVTSATSPFRVILPLKKEFAYVFTNLATDPGEKHPLQAWAMPRLLSLVTKNHGKEAAAWLEEAEQAGRWWVNEQKRVWDYRGE